MPLSKQTKPVDSLPDPLFELRIETRLDVALAYRQAITVVKLLDLPVVEQTKIGTSVSEVLRFMVAHFSNVWMNTRIQVDQHDKKGHLIEINISGETERDDLDEEGINNLQDTSEIKTATLLMDEMTVEAQDDRALLTMRKNCHLISITEEHKTKLQTALKDKAGVSPYQELKDKNQQLESLMVELEKKNAEINCQLREIKLLNKRLDTTNESLTEFAYTLSHDLKNPLTTLKLLVQLGRQSEDKTETFDLLNPVINNMNDIVSGLIEIIDVDQDTSGNVKTIRFEEELNNLLSEYRYQLEEEGGELNLHLEVKEIDYVKPYLASIVRNLVSNAIKYRCPSRKPVINLSTQRQDPFVVLKVADNGIGMDLEKNGEQIFKPFQRFTEEQTGKGIGLHLIKKMVEKNHGRMEVSSKVGEGTTFTCMLMPYKLQ
ncbi:ATP-binding protein [Roseivirga sp. BDSF3-8]|uniref:sensor histidine kinase n=1 Tax=Roseivirga sp. BDSF3-8 TaxID=3241598 RepID=UPI003532541E